MHDMWGQREVASCCRSGSLAVEMSKTAYLLFAFQLQPPDRGQKEWGDVLFLTGRESALTAELTASLHCAGVEEQQHLLAHKL